MRKVDGEIELSAGDLSNHISCRHLTYLDLAVAKGILPPPEYRDPMLAILQERGLEFEQSYLNILKDKGLQIAKPTAENDETSLQRTIQAMQQGVDVIYQASLKSGMWQGRADFLVKIDNPSKLGAWSYEVIDSKLARETRTGTILQLCLYTQMVADIQGVMPEFMYVITPDEEFTKITYRLDDFLAYYRLIQGRLEEVIKKDNGIIPTYPIPCAHCEICNWWQQCDSRRRTDDHLSLVAGLSNSHVIELKKWDIETLEKLANLPLPLQHKPSRGAVETFERLREQARVQHESRLSKKPVYEYLGIEEGRGFFKLPLPSEGDIFFDFESDPFAGPTGIEYLFGWVLIDDPEPYHCIWALTSEYEKKAFETFVVMVMARWQAFPNLHIYHYTPYEPAALKRLMGKHATRETEIDQMLRAGLFIDLHSVTKQALRAGIETYSLKELEKFHGFERKVALRDAALQLRALEGFIERKNLKEIPEETIEAVQTYNKEDCLSTLNLRDWLESLRDRLIKNGHSIARRELFDGLASDALTEHQKRIQDLFDKLIVGVPIDPIERTPEQQATWLLANMLDWYRREKKANWWEYFRLCDLPDNELIEEKAAIAGLRFTGQRQQDKKSFVDMYSFPSQEFDIREGDELKTGDGNSLGKVFTINAVSGLIGIRKGPKTADSHPTSVFKHTDVRDTEKEEAIIRIASWVAENGMNANGEYRAGRDLLQNLLPRTAAGFQNQDPAQKKAVLWVQALVNGTLPIQGPPGSGKSHTAADIILAIIQSGKKVGITALSHKVITGLMQKVVKAANESGIPVQCLRKVTTVSQVQDPQIIEETKNEKVVSNLNNGNIRIFGGTPWLWAREDMANSVDVLFVDEAGQLSLIDTVAVSQAASNMVLLGDPQQLKQPQQGSHPEGTEVSALEHILKEHKTIPSEQGIFLDVTWRLHPKICSFISELFYESRLVSKPELIKQQLDGNTQFQGAGLWFKAIQHEGNQSSSREEAEVVSGIISDLLKGDVYYTDNKGERKKLSVDDIKVIAPYNAQVNLLLSALPPEIQVGTVDKFQGQEAPVIIFSMATSSPEDAPRGMEFLYSLNRLNVAVSRAKAAFILVGSPKLFEPDCKSVEQMKLANAFCRFLEIANRV
jgi:predicted RecB family nuclease